VEHDDQPPVATFFADRALVDGQTVDLGEGAAHHARVKRLSVGDVISLTDGTGVLATASIVALRKNDVECRVERTRTAPPPPPLHVRAPIGDRDRMLWLAEKATEFGVTTWQGVRFRRSMSVSPRGEGAAFVAKLRLRMIAALEQSGGAWLPAMLPDVDLDAITTAPGARSIVLDPSGRPLLRVLDRSDDGEPTVLFGPEGGIEPAELAMLEANGWRRARLGSTILRFETAGLAAIGVIRAAQLLNED
jgi:16S rRNA (uracil1498-N3)-methyltransferase